MFKRSIVYFCFLSLVMLFCGSITMASQEIEGYININTATAEELQMLPGIGESTAQGIVAFRNANGPFKSVDGLMKVKGIGEKKLNAIKAYLRLEGKTTLHIK